MRLLDVEVDEVTEVGPAVRDGRLSHHQSSGQVELTQRTAERSSTRGPLYCLLSLRLESERTLEVVFAELPSSNQPVNPSVRHLISSKLERPESWASLPHLPEDRVVGSAANLQGGEARGDRNKTEQSLLLSVTGSEVTETTNCQLSPTPG